MSIQKGFLLAIALLLSVSACTVQDVPVEVEEPIQEDIPGYFGVNEELWPYFARFEEEALQRGEFVDLREARITGEIEEIEEDRVAGSCRYSSHFPNHVTIDLEFWEAASDLAREFVVFHELGHCELGRAHRESAREDGTCVSLMRSGIDGCRDNYRPSTRRTYLDELFDPVFWNTIN